MSFRRLFKGAHGPMLALCALIGVLWVGSYRSVAHAKLPVSPGATRWEFTSLRGALCVALTDNYPTGNTAHFAARRADADMAAAADDRYHNAAIAGLGFEDAQLWLPDGDGDFCVRRWTALHLPYWLLLAVAMLGPLHGVYVVARAYRRTTHNQCGDCGYDLGDGEVCQACAARAALIGASSRVQLVR
jgi:hypothetical protein